MTYETKWKVAALIISVFGIAILFTVDWRVAVGSFILFFAHNAERHLIK
jgi:hypothetical protein